jgi:hypothetical protein
MPNAKQAETTATGTRRPDSLPGGSGPRKRAAEAARGAQRAVSSVVASTPKVVRKAKGLAADVRGSSTIHVDVVKNEWLAGYQVVVARLSLKAGIIDVDARDAEYREVALRPVGGIDPEADPEGFLRALADHVHGSYLFATELHDDGSCPYKGMVVPMESQHERLRHAEPV